MKRSIFLFVILALSSWANAETVVHYNVDFSSPVHTVGNPPTTGNSSNTISLINFGRPMVESSFGSLTNQPLVFNPKDETYEQIELTLGRGYDNYQLSFDIETANLVGSLYGYKIIFDAPIVQVLDFHGTYGMQTFNPNPLSLGTVGLLGSFGDNEFMHINIAVDLKNNLWEINIGSLPIYTGLFYAENDVTSIRFGLSPRYLGANLDNNVFVAIDNIVVSSTAVPEPATFILLSLGVMMLRKKCHKSLINIEIRER